MGKIARLITNLIDKEDNRDFLIKHMEIEKMLIPEAFKEEISLLLTQLAVAYNGRGEIQKAIEYYKEALAIL